MREKLSITWQGYHAKNAEEARAAFVKRYGYEPQRVFQAGPVWLAGPVDASKS